MMRPCLIPATPLPAQVLANWTSRSPIEAVVTAQPAPRSMAEIEADMEATVSAWRARSTN